MKARIRQYVHGIIFVIGLVLIVGGIATKTYGAWIVGLIVAAVDFQQWNKWNKQRSTGEKEKPQG